MIRVFPWKFILWNHCCSTSTQLFLQEHYLLLNIVYAKLYLDALIPEPLTDWLSFSSWTVIAYLIGCDMPSCELPKNRAAVVLHGLKLPLYTLIQHLILFFYHLSQLLLTWFLFAQWMLTAQRALKGTVDVPDIFRDASNMPQPMKGKIKNWKLEIFDYCAELSYFLSHMACHWGDLLFHFLIIWSAFPVRRS